MGRELIVFASEKGFIGRIEEADKLVLFNMDTGEKVEVENPFKYGINSLEEFFEENDPSVLFVSGINEELEFLIEENGVHVKKYKSSRIDDVLKELFIKG